MILSFGFKIYEFDKCVYFKFSQNKGVLLCLYVDDLLIFGTNIDSIIRTKEFLFTHFDMKDMGTTNVILGIKIQKNDNEYILTQSHYIEKILHKFNHFDCILVSTLYHSNLKLTYNKRRVVSQEEYARIIGSLMYAMHCTRPDIAYAVSKLSRYISKPNLMHWNVIHRVLKYLRKTMYYGLNYVAHPPILEGYSDAS